MSLPRRFAHGTSALLSSGRDGAACAPLARVPSSARAAGAGRGAERGNGVSGDARAAMAVRLSHLAGKE